VLESKAHVCVEFMVDTEDQMWLEVERVMADTATRLVITPALHLHLPTNLERRSSVIGYGELLKYSGLIQKMIVEGKVRHRGELALAEHVNRSSSNKNGRWRRSVKSEKPRPNRTVPVHGVGHSRIVTTQNCGQTCVCCIKDTVTFGHAIV
jgi:hypothetical protein